MDISYKYLYSMSNLILAWRKARKNKTRKLDIVAFEKNLEKNLLKLQVELKNKTYCPKPLKTFVLRDPKTRRISKADFTDRVVHHALINVVGPILQKSFIHDSCANQKKKGTSFVLKRFEIFARKVTHNYKRGAFCLKADIKHYFREVDHKILLNIICRKIKDDGIIWLIQRILNANSSNEERESTSAKGMPLGNYTSQFLANVYLGELDHFIKHRLKQKYYIRYVDDFVIFHTSKKKLESIKVQMNFFLKKKLKLELHKQKSRMISLSRGIDFVGFRHFNHYRLLRKRSFRGMRAKINSFRENNVSSRKLIESHQGWQAYASWANTHNLKERIRLEIINIMLDKV